MKRINKDIKVSIRLKRPQLFFVFGAGYTDADCEKAVLPTLIFINLKHPEMRQEEPIASGFALCLGWWNLYVRFMFGRVPQ